MFVYVCWGCCSLEEFGLKRVEVGVVCHAIGD